MRPGTGYLAHSRNAAGVPHALSCHLTEVARIAAAYAAPFGAAEEARLAGVLHDLGKYGDLFQLRLRGEAHGVDHWSPGAWVGLATHRNMAAALAVQGHHIGLQQLDPDSLKGIAPDRLGAHHPLGLRLSEADPDVPVRRLLEEGVTLATPPPLLYGPRPRATASAMLDARMLYSALVDADFLDTEAHFDPDAAHKRRERTGAAAIEPGTALGVLLRYIENIRDNAFASDSVRQIRADLLAACLDAAGSSCKLWVLAAPTGAGKTLAMLAFALRQHHTPCVTGTVPQRAAEAVEEPTGRSRLLSRRRNRCPATKLAAWALWQPGRAKPMEGSRLMVRCGIDIDGVLCDHVRGICAWIAQQYDVKLTPDQVTEWDLDFGPSSISKALQAAYGDDSFLFSLSPTAGACDSVARLLDAKCLELVAVTARPPRTGPVTDRWLAIHFPSLHAVYSARKEEVAVHVLLDDHAPSVERFAASGREAILFAQPWNRSDHTRLAGSSRVSIVGGWGEAVLAVQSLADGNTTAADKVTTG